MAISLILARLPNIVMTLLIGVLLSINVWFKPSRGRIDEQIRGKRIRILISTLASSLIFLFLTGRFRPSEMLQFYLIVSLLVALGLRILRIHCRDTTNAFRLNAMITCDVLVSIAAVYLWISTLKGLSSARGPLSPGYAFGFPAFYSLTLTYLIYNIGRLAEDKIVLARWRLLAYAFPEGGGHAIGKIGKHPRGGLGFADMLGWTLALLVSSSGILLGYWLSGHDLMCMVCLAAMFLLSLTFVILGGMRGTRTNSQLDLDLKYTLLGTGILIGGLLGMELLFRPFWSGDTQLKSRIIRAMAVSSPLYIGALSILPRIPRQMGIVCSRELRRSQGLHAISAVAEAARIAAFSQKTTRGIQAGLISLVFVFYLLFPRSAKVFRLVGFTEIGGMSIEEAIDRFTNIASQWTITTSLNGEEFAGFVFGNQGLVLLFLLWCLATFMGWMNVADRLANAPNLCNSRTNRFFVHAHFPLFVIVFSPFVFLLAILIPVLGAVLAGYSVAIILGVFSFGLFLPRIEAYLLSLFYVLMAIPDWGKPPVSVNINRATVEELILLPGIGRRLANRITGMRPFRTTGELQRISGIDRNKMEHLKHLIHV